MLFRSLQDSRVRFRRSSIRVLGADEGILSASLPNVLNILGLWFILFLLYAIFYTGTSRWPSSSRESLTNVLDSAEVFALTRWGPNGTRTANYSAFANALVMLALASTGLVDGLLCKESRLT